MVIPPAAALARTVLWNLSGMWQACGRHVGVLAVRIIILMDCMPDWMPESCGVMLNLASAVDVEGRTN